MEQDLHSEIMHAQDLDENAIRQDTHGTPMKSAKKLLGYNIKNQVSFGHHSPASLVRIFLF